MTWLFKNCYALPLVNLEDWAVRCPHEQLLGQCGGVKIRLEETCFLRSTFPDYDRGATVQQQQ